MSMDAARDVLGTTGPGPNGTLVSDGILMAVGEPPIAVPAPDAIELRLLAMLDIPWLTIDSASPKTLLALASSEPTTWLASEIASDMMDDMVDCSPAMSGLIIALEAAVGDGAGGGGAGHANICVTTGMIVCLTPPGCCPPGVLANVNIPEGP